MAEIMDPFAYELLACPPPPSFDQFSFPCGGTTNEDITIEQMDDYLRAIGALPPCPLAADAPPSPAATFHLRFAMDDHASDRNRVHTPAAVPHPLASTSDDNSAATPYDADIDASLRAMEKDPAERPSPDYLATTQAGRIDPAARASLVQWMFDFSRFYFLDESSILHRAVSYVDRYLSTRALPEDEAGGGHRYRLRVVGAVALYAAAKLEDAARDLSPADIACWCGYDYDTTYREVLGAERAMVDALGYRLAGPTACTFVDHVRRHAAQPSGRRGRRGRGGAAARGAPHCGRVAVRLPVP